MRQFGVSRTHEASSSGWGDQMMTAEHQHLYLRNYDQERGYDVVVGVETVDAVAVFEGEYHLRPGAVRREPEIIPAGTYRVRATLEDDRSTSRQCRVGSPSRRTAVVEVGNGAVALSNRLR